MAKKNIDTTKRFKIGPFTATIRETKDRWGDDVFRMTITDRRTKGRRIIDTETESGAAYQLCMFLENSTATASTPKDYPFLMIHRFSR